MLSPQLIRDMGHLIWRYGLRDTHDAFKLLRERVRHDPAAFDALRPKE